MSSRPDPDEDAYAPLEIAWATPTAKDSEAILEAWERLGSSTQKNTIGFMRKLRERGYSATPTGLMELIVDMEKGRLKPKLAATTVTCLKDALARVAATTGASFKDGPWRQLKAVMQSYARHNPPTRKERGAIELGQFWQLVQFARERGGDADEENIDALHVEYAFGFRVSRVRTVVRKEFFKLATGGWRFHGLKHKNSQMHSPIELMDRLPCMDGLCEEIDAIMEKHDKRNAEQPMFPNYDATSTLR